MHNFITVQQTRQQSPTSAAGRQKTLNIKPVDLSAINSRDCNHSSADRTRKINRLKDTQEVQKLIASISDASIKVDDAYYHKILDNQKSLNAKDSQSERGKQETVLYRNSVEALPKNSSLKKKPSQQDENNLFY